MVLLRMRIVRILTFGYVMLLECSRNDVILNVIGCIPRGAINLCVSSFCIVQFVSLISH